MTASYEALATSTEWTTASNIANAQSGGRNAMKIKTFGGNPVVKMIGKHKVLKVYRV